MKRTEKQAFFAQTLQEMRTALEQKRRACAALGMEAHTGKAKNVHAMRTCRRDLAQLMTMYRIKELQDAK